MMVPHRTIGLHHSSVLGSRLSCPALRSEMFICDLTEAALRSQANNKYNFRVADSKSLGPDSNSSFSLVGDANASRSKLSLSDSYTVPLTNRVY